LPRAVLIVPPETNLLDMAHALRLEDASTQVSTSQLPGLVGRGIKVERPLIDKTSPEYLIVTRETERWYRVGMDSSRDEAMGEDK
jgi:hypothetical protein